MDRLAATLVLDEPVGRVPRVSPARAKALGKLGIFSVRDLLTNYPRRYIDLSLVRTVADARIGEQCTVRGIVRRITLKTPRPKLSLVEIALTDDTGTLVITAFNQKWLMDRLPVGTAIAVAGAVEFNYGFKRMVNPFIEELSGGATAGKVIPVHPACEKISTAWMRRLEEEALALCAGLYDPLPLSLRCRYRLMARGCALQTIHFPKSLDDAAAARRRLAFEEVLFLQLLLLKEGRARFAGKTPIAHTVDGPRTAALERAVPFELTGDQKRARAELAERLAAPVCANHLILGDVGTGKTVLAAFAVAAAADSGCQCLFMAPTEVLARQHAKSLGPLFDASGISWGILTAATSSEERSALAERLAAGTLDVLVGTHALLEDDVAPARLGLCIIDEQQRFGVEQRAGLLRKGEAPDALYLTATPIPRTLALTLYGDLSLSYLREKPHAGVARTTRVLTREHRGAAFDAVQAALARGEQAYVVCPLVGLDGAARDGKAVAARDGGAEGAGGARASSRQGREELDETERICIECEADFGSGNPAAAVAQAGVIQTRFPDARVEVLHGKMSGTEKDEVMGRFRAGETQVLVATTVIEVGVDVPNATVMIVEDADRFGLSQLHQLRGRVGRGGLAGEVFLVSNSTSPTALERLAAMERTEDGFELAAFDLGLRREGDILGNRQHGTGILKLVSVARDGALIQAAHDAAEDILDRDPELTAPEHAALARELRVAFKGGHAKQGG